MNTDPLWYKDAVFYEVFVRAFADSNGDGIGDLAGLTAKLDYLQWLGVDAVWMLPIFPSPLRDDGYDVADYCAVHPDYGTLDDVRRLIDEAHRRDLRIIVELIPNHTSDQNAWFQASRDPNHPEHTKYRDWYVWSDTDLKYLDTRIIFLDTEPSNWTFDPLRGAVLLASVFLTPARSELRQPGCTAGHAPGGSVLVRRGADAFRVDATPYLYEREDANGENLPETHAYLKRLRAFVDAYAPGTMLLSEANMWPEDVRPYLGGDPADPSVPGDEFHMNFHFPLMPRIFMALARADRTPIEQILARTPPIPANCQWGTFLRCHDELTLEMVTPEERQFMWDFYASDPRMKLNMGIRRRLAPLLGNDRSRIELSNSIFLTLVGSPVLYYGDEIGMGDNIELDDRDGVRTPMQWSDASNAGFSSADPSALGDPVIDDPVYGYQQVNVDAQRADAGSLLNRMREMIAVRKTCSAFGRGELQLLKPAGVAMLAYLRAYGDEVVLVVNNLSSEPQQVDLDLAAFAGARPADLFTGQVLAQVTEVPYRVALERYGYSWLRLRSRELR